MKKNRRTIQIIILIGVVLLGGYAIGNALFSSNDGLPQKGSPPPDFALVGLDGSTHRLADYKGKALIINFWGTFCPGCVYETPDLQSQYEKHKDKPFEIVGINLGEDEFTVKQFVKQYNVSYPIVYDTNRSVERKYGLRSYPTTFFVRPDGTIMDIYVGPMTEKDIDERVTELLKS
ncbi:Thiol-disulfide oxidoreductase ResA [Paenibacillus plantiphilus]|uniref:Thiol-disulfide oxidoreductase ResA n=1 Tax=Paenibacillus plantiphilus TaxID=2905650 RepID=A0ABN8GJF8_9BACL|nr:redoxin family protein [Paenibacillus plantiphilus]CAH1210498.1 Thiol-disulfide oxidoreductase ResA [Paenibacillus plantiphilus]